MTETQLEKFKKQLETELGAAMAKRKRLPNVDAPERPADIIELASSFCEDAVVSKTEHASDQKLRLIIEALERIESGEFGVCQDCGEEISLKRLNAVPWAEYCIPCQEKADDTPDEVKHHDFSHLYPADT